jgi:hypothetical protein
MSQLKIVNFVSVFSSSQKFLYSSVLATKINKASDSAPCYSIINTVQNLSNTWHCHACTVFWDSLRPNASWYHKWQVNVNRLIHCKLYYKNVTPAINCRHILCSHASWNFHKHTGISVIQTLLWVEIWVPIWVVHHPIVICSDQWRRLCMVKHSHAMTK